MASIKFEVVKTDPLPAARSTGEDGTRQSIGSRCAGTRVLLRCRHAEFYVQAPYVDPAVTYNFEGPYLRIYPDFGPQTGQQVLAGFGGAQTFSRAIGGTVTSSLLNPSSDTPYYEVDANNCSIYLPWNCTLELYSDYAGIWLYDLYDVGIDPLINTVTNANLTQTRVVKGGNERTVAVPMGAHSVQLAGDSGVSMTPGQGDAPKVIGLNSTQINNASIGTGFWPYAPGVLGNARTFDILATTEDHDGALIFGVQVP